MIGKLENRQYIIFNPQDRVKLYDECANKLSSLIMTEEDINTTIRERVGAHLDDLSAQNFTESEAFKNQKKQLKAELSENALNGLYFKKPLRNVVQEMSQYLFDSTYVEDVFESDEVLFDTLKDHISKFDESKIA